MRAASKGICSKGEGREVVLKTILPFVRRVSGPFGQLLQNGSRHDVLAQEATASFPSLKKDGAIEPQPTPGWVKPVIDSSFVSHMPFTLLVSAHSLFSKTMGMENVLKMRDRERLHLL